MHSGTPGADPPQAVRCRSGKDSSRMAGVRRAAGGAAAGSGGRYPERMAPSRAADAVLPSATCGRSNPGSRAALRRSDAAHCGPRSSSGDPGGLAGPQRSRGAVSPCRSGCPGASGMARGVGTAAHRSGAAGDAGRPSCCAAILGATPIPAETRSSSSDPGSHARLPGAESGLRSQGGRSDGPGGVAGARCPKHAAHTAGCGCAAAGSLAGSPSVPRIPAASLGCHRCAGDPSRFRPVVTADGLQPSTLQAITDDGSRFNTLVSFLYDGVLVCRLRSKAGRSDSALRPCAALL